MTHHLDERPWSLDTSLRHSLTSWMFRFARTAPFFQPRNPFPNSSLGKTNHSHNNSENKLVRNPTFSEFRTENCKKHLYSFFHAHQCQESWAITMRAPNYCYLSLGSCASDVFSQVMSLAKWLSVPSNGVCQVTGWKRVAILVNSCDGEVRA